MKYDIQVSFRGTKHIISMNDKNSIMDLKNGLISNLSNDISIEPFEIKLIYKGKILSDHEALLQDCLGEKDKTSNKPIKIMAMGVSSQEATKNKELFEKAKRNAPRIRDDLSSQGRANIASRQRLGRQLLSQAAKKESKHSSKSFGFHRIETLPMLPEQNKAKEILNSLTNDPGILACMEKHNWNVGCLAEMYPEGKVGESEVCIMGLNQNKGQKILLRLRTDDLKGFRKILSIRKVLFHELAHNVHSEHDGEFFKLMRQVEKECNELDWSRNGATVGGSQGTNFEYGEFDKQSGYQGGTYILGTTSETAQSGNLTRRELAARAALMRMSKEEEEIQEACGCSAISQQSEAVITESRTTSNDMNTEDHME